MTTKEFFLNLNEQIEGARTLAALRVLSKHGRRYVNDLPSTTDKKILKQARSGLKRSLRLIKKKSKELS